MDRSRVQDHATALDDAVCGEGGGGDRVGEKEYEHIGMQMQRVMRGALEDVQYKRQGGGIAGAMREPWTGVDGIIYALLFGHEIGVQITRSRYVTRRRVSAVAENRQFFAIFSSNCHLNLVFVGATS